MYRVGIIAVAALSLAGCASVTRGTTENLSIMSTPAGAQVDIAGLDVPAGCVTPCVVQVKRNADISVAIKKDGFEPQVIPLTREVPGSGAAGFAGNILIGGVVGMGVDAVTGAAWDHKPNPLEVVLLPTASPPALPPSIVRKRPAKPRPTPVAQAGT